MTRSLAFLDESGDTGRPGFGGSPLLIVGMAVFSDAEGVNQCAAAIAALRTAIGKPNNYEFHFRTNSDVVRRKFLATLSRSAFAYYAIILEKGLRQNLTGLELYVAACARLCTLAGNTLDYGTLVADEVAKDRHTNQQLATILRNRVNATAGREALHKVKVRNSARDSLLQVADYVAGVVGRAAREDEKAGAAAYMRMLRRTRAAFGANRCEDKEIPGPSFRAFAGSKQPFTATIRTPGDSISGYHRRATETILIRLARRQRSAACGAPKVVSCRAQLRGIVERPVRSHISGLQRGL